MAARSAAASTVKTRATLRPTATWNSANTAKANAGAARCDRGSHARARPNAQIATATRRMDARA
jgi:hypothetical protein